MRIWPRRGRLDHLAHHDPGLAGIFFQPLAQKFVDDAFDHRTHFGRNQLVLGLRREFGVRHFYRNDAGQAFAAIVAGKLHLFLFAQARAFGVTRDLAGEPGAEAGEMRAAVALRDVVGEDQHVLVVGIVPPQGDFDGDAVALAAYQHRLADQRALGAVEIAHEGFEAALVEHSSMNGTSFMDRTITVNEARPKTEGGHSGSGGRGNRGGGGYGGGGRSWR